jgi:hypothetical protein
MQSVLSEPDDESIEDRITSKILMGSYHASAAYVARLALMFGSLCR